MQNIGPKLRHELKKVGQKTVFTRGENEQSILCRNKPKLLPNSGPGVYQLDCTCKRKYIGESKKKSLNTPYRASTRQHKGRLEPIRRY